MMYAKNGFFRKLFAPYLLLFVLVFLTAGIFTSLTLHKRMLSYMKDSAITQAQILGAVYIGDVLSNKNMHIIHRHVLALKDKVEARVTVISSDGFVLGDSELTDELLVKMDNHANRPEIREALKGLNGSATRFSNTLGKDMLYVAVPMVQETKVVGVVRVAYPLDQVREILASLRNPVVFVSAAGIALLFIISLMIGRYFTRRIRILREAASNFARGDLGSKISMEEDDEFGLLADRMNHMAGNLRERIEEIESEKKKSSTILENMVEGVVALDGGRRVLSFNRGAEAITGLSRESLVGKTLFEALMNEPIDNLMSTAMKERKVISGAMDLGHLGKKSLRVNAVGFSESVGDVAGILVFSDITAIHAAEGMRKEFVANVSHELRTPLTSIKGFIETLLGGAKDDPESSKKFLKMMEEDSDRLTRLIDDLLELSRIESKGMVLNKEPIDFKREVKKIAAFFSSRLQERNITLKNNISDQNIPGVSLDSDSFKQVMINLLDNAIKFNKDNGDIILDAKTHGDTLRVSVQDTGVGIPPEALPRIFERFFRVDKARSLELGGTGLGLSIVKHIIEAHGGEVSSQSVLGQGSIFVFTLPLS